MTQAYLNGAFTALEDAQISPMDRGFLFGDGVYEVIPCYDGKLVAMPYHLERLAQSLSGISLASPLGDEALTRILTELVDRNGGGDLCGRTTGHSVLRRSGAWIMGGVADQC